MSTTTSCTRRTFLAGTSLALAAPALSGLSQALAAETVEVETASGTLRGASADGAFSFKGVPYAADTGGANRFLAPQPVKWQGVRDALVLGDRCPQISETMSVKPMYGWYGDASPMGEDCCVLNVYTPGLGGDSKRPVMFYIHGGGYINGSGGGAGVDGTNLAKFGDVVVVTINHRLNAFGFTNLEKAGDDRFADAANAGQIDIVAALRWVKDNISAFGGDPGNVTVFGQSGGGSKIMILLGMPEAKGLFHKAISMSGAAGLNVDPAADMLPYVDALLKEAGSLERLREMTADELLKARSAAVKASGLEGARPVIDGKHIVTRAMTPEGLATQADVPLLLGTTATEASLFFQDDMRNFDLTEEQAKARMMKVFNLDDAQADTLMAAYREDVPGRTPSQVLVAVASDVQFRVPMNRAAEAKSAAGGAPAYLYNFAWQIPLENGVIGSPHAVDIPFAFGNVEAARAMTGPGDAPVDASLNLMSAFVAFARTGDPSNQRMPAWKPYDAETRTTMVVDATCRVSADHQRAGRLASENLKLDPFNRAALYVFEG